MSSDPYVKRFMPDGDVRCIVTDNNARRERSQGLRFTRASNVEVAVDGDGKEVGSSLYCVDFTRLSEFTGRNEFAVCLLNLFETHGDAVKAEVEWLKTNYIMEGLST